MVVKDLDNLRLLDADHALALLGMIDEHDPAPRRSDQVRARDQPDRAPQRVDDDRSPVVDVLDLLGNVGDQVIGTPSAGSRPSARDRVPRA